MFGFLDRIIPLEILIRVLDLLDNHYLFSEFYLPGYVAVRIFILYSSGSGKTA
jgi:hypothetical protein